MNYDKALNRLLLKLSGGVNPDAFYVDFYEASYFPCVTIAWRISGTWTTVDYDSYPEFINALFDAAGV